MMGMHHVQTVLLSVLLCCFFVSWVVGAPEMFNERAFQKIYHERLLLEFPSLQAANASLGNMKYKFDQIAWERLPLDKQMMKGTYFDVGNTSDTASKKKFLIKMNHQSAGFSVYLLFVIKKLLLLHSFEEFSHMQPCIYFGETSIPKNYRFGGKLLYWQPNKNPNMWLNYFMPLGGEYGEGGSGGNISTSVNCNPDDDDVYTPSSWFDMWFYNHVGPFHTPYGRFALKGVYKNVKVAKAWHHANIAVANLYVNRYFRLQPHIIKKANEFWKKHIGEYRLQHPNDFNKYLLAAPSSLSSSPLIKALKFSETHPFIIGVHLRGTDKMREKWASAGIKHPKLYYPCIRRLFALLKKLGVSRNMVKLFVATDDVTMMNAIQQNYPERIIMYNATRSSGIEGVHHEKGNVTGYTKGEDALLDQLFLSRSNYLIKCSSALSEFARYYNPALDSRCIDVNIETCHQVDWRNVHRQLRKLVDSS